MLNIFLEEQMSTGEHLRGRNLRSRISKVILYAILIGFSLTATVLSVRYFTLSQVQSTKIDELERALHELSARMNVDSIRQFSIQKVIAIIDRHNPKMESSLKYEIANTVYEMSVKYPNIDVDLICATITQETGKTWDPRVVSPAGAMGMMQLMPTTAMYVAAYEGVNWTTPEQVLFNPIINIRLGCRYLSAMIDEFEIDGGLAAYNGGQRIAAKWIKQNYAAGVLYAETENYVPSVKKFWKEYRQMTM